jgi:TonB-dependent starch-binding outer membrane protein SusC
MIKFKRYFPAFVGILLVAITGGLLPNKVLAQETKQIKGTVRSGSDKTPLPGVTVTIKGGNTGTVTSTDGTYQIPAKSTDVIVFSFIGFKNQEVTVGDKTTLDVALNEDASELSEVVVIGYGTVEKSDLTGSVGQVNVAEMVKAPVSSFAEALAGRVAGVQVSANDGQPGSGVNIIIRGAGSLTQSTSPLYVIDGFPVEDPNQAALNPEDIESLTVLKDAASTAIYGSRAANGVILIQTKRGKVGKPVITYGSSLGFQRNLKKKEMMSPYEFVKYINELHPTQTYAQQYLEGDKNLDYYRDVDGIDWADQVFRTGSVQIHNLALRGGTEQTKYAISGSIYDQNGVVINTGLNRYTGRLTVDQQINNRLKAGVTGNYSVVSSFGQPIAANASVGPSSTVLFRTWAYRPITPDLSGSFLYADVDEDAIYGGDVRVNPFVDLENQHQLNKTNLLEGNAYISYDILDGLTLKITGGVRRNHLEEERFYNSKTSQGSPYNPNNTNGVNGSIRNTNANSWSNEYVLNYKKTFGEAHTITGLGLYSLNKYTTALTGFSSRLLPNESLGIAGLNEGVAYDPVASTSENTLSSYATRWDYNYKSKYILTGTFRADGSSKFAEHWGYFPGAAFAWNMDREEIFADALPFISSSKIRLSYGSNGNNRVADFARFARLTQNLNGGYSFNNETPTGGVYIAAMANDDLRWEKVTSIDLGYEIGVFRNRITLEADLYRKTTNDLLLNAPLPPTTGFGSAVKNIGSLRNDGLELTLNTVNIESGSFSWTSNFNISFNRNKILSLNRGQQSLTTVAAFESQFNTPLYISEVGKPAGLMYGYVWEGNYQYEDFDNPSPDVYILKNSVPANGNARATILPGDIKYKDLNNDGLVNTYDKTIIGRGQPIHIGGFSNNIRYKGFSLNAFFQWAYGNSIYNANRLSLEGNSNARLNMNQFASYVNRWSPENPTNANFRAGGHGPIGYHSSRVVEDGSFLRLKTLSLDYSIPKRLAGALKMSDLSLNVSAQNLFTLTNYSGLDPEASVRHPVLSPGFDFSAYPQAQTIVLGVKAAF